MKKGIVKFVHLTANQSGIDPNKISSEKLHKVDSRFSLLPKNVLYLSQQVGDTSYWGKLYQEKESSIQSNDSEYLEEVSNSWGKNAYKFVFEIDIEKNKILKIDSIFQLRHFLFRYGKTEKTDRTNYSICSLIKKIQIIQDFLENLPSKRIENLGDIESKLREKKYPKLPITETEVIVSKKKPITSELILTAINQLNVFYDELRTKNFENRYYTDFYSRIFYEKVAEKYNGIWFTEHLFEELKKMRENDEKIYNNYLFCPNYHLTVLLWIKCDTLIVWNKNAIEN